MERYAEYNNNIIGYTEVRNLNCFYFTKYYPVNKYGYTQNQQFVFDLKNGVNPEYYAEIFSIGINKLFGNLAYKKDLKKMISDITIIPVPASSNFNHERRFKKLFELISEKTGVINGYDVVEILNDKEPKHLTNHHNSLESHVKIHFEKIKEPRKIILIDDVITTGKTISEFANKFRSNKLNFGFVVAMALSKTISFNEMMLEDSLIRNNKNFNIGMNNIESLNSLEIFTSKINTYSSQKLFYKEDLTKDLKRQSIKNYSI